MEPEFKTLPVKAGRCVQSDGRGSSQRFPAVRYLSPGLIWLMSDRVPADAALKCRDRRREQNIPSRRVFLRNTGTRVPARRAAKKGSYAGRGAVSINDESSHESASKRAVDIRAGFVYSERLSVEKGPFGSSYRAPSNLPQLRLQQYINNLS